MKDAGHVTLDDVRELVGDADPEEVLRVVRGLGRIIARAILRGKALTTETRRARRRSEA